MTTTKLSRIKARELFCVALLFSELASWLWRATISSYEKEPLGFHGGLSYIVSDATFVVPKSVYKNRALFGFHYFGDLQNMFGYGAQKNAYGASPTQIPPFGNLWASSLAVLGPTATAPLYILVSLVIPALLIFVWFKNDSLSNALIGYCALVLVNVSTFIALDRGSVLLIVMPFVGFGLHRTLMEEKYDIAASIFFAIAIGNKPYIACLFIFYILEKRWLFTLKVAILTIVINVLSMISFTGNIIQNFLQMLRAMSWFNSSSSIEDFSRGCAAFFRIVSDVAIAIYGFPEAMHILTTTPHLVTYCSLFWLVFVVSFCANKKIPVWIRVTAALSTSQLVVAASPGYTCLWTMVVGVSMFQVFPSGKKSENSAIELREFVSGVVIAFAIAISSIFVSSHNAYSPRAWLIAFVIVRVIYAVPVTKYRWMRTKWDQIIRVAL